MKATDLYQLVTERETDEMGKVSYKNDHTPDNHVKNKKMKEVNPLPDKGEKKDKHPTAKVGDVRKKERRSMEGPKTGVRRMSEQAPAVAGYDVQELVPGGTWGQFVNVSPKTGQLMVRNVQAPNRPWMPIPNEVLRDQETHRSLQVLSGNRPPQEQQAAFMSILSKATKQASSVAGTMGRRTGGRSVGAPMSQQQISQAGAGWQLEDEGSSGMEVQELEPEEIEAAPAPSGLDVEELEPEEITLRGHAPQRESVENPGSMKRKQPVNHGGQVSKSGRVRSGKQNDEPKPTAQVGKPKKKEKRSMDENPVTVKDWKGGENEHKKMGMHEGIKALEKLLNREIDVTFLESDVDEAWDLAKAEKAAAAKSRPVATGGIKRMAAAGKPKARSTQPEPGEEKEGSFWHKVKPHMGK